MTRAILILLSILINIHCANDQGDQATKSYPIVRHLLGNLPCSKEVPDDSLALENFRFFELSYLSISPLGKIFLNDVLSTVYEYDDNSIEKVPELTFCKVSSMAFSKSGKLYLACDGYGLISYFDGQVKDEVTENMGYSSFVGDFIVGMSVSDSGLVYLKAHNYPIVKVYNPVTNQLDFIIGNEESPNLNSINFPDERPDDSKPDQFIARIKAIDVDGEDLYLATKWGIHRYRDGTLTTLIKWLPYDENMKQPIIDGPAEETYHEGIGALRLYKGRFYFTEYSPNQNGEGGLRYVEDGQVKTLIRSPEIFDDSLTGDFSQLKDGTIDNSRFVPYYANQIEFYQGELYFISLCQLWKIEFEEKKAIE